MVRYHVHKSPPFAAIMRQINPFQSLYIYWPSPKLFIPFRNVIRFYSEKLLASRLNPELEGHPLSSVRYCLFNIFVATLHICNPSPLFATWVRAMPWWLGTPCHEVICVTRFKQTCKLVCWGPTTWASRHILLRSYRGNLVTRASKAHSFT
jgi:hypothetical protein